MGRGGFCGTAPALATGGVNEGEGAADDRAGYTSLVAGPELTILVLPWADNVTWDHGVHPVMYMGNMLSARLGF